MFAVVKQATAPDKLTTGFASTETFRRVGFLVDPLLVVGLSVPTVGVLGTSVGGLSLCPDAFCAILRAVGMLIALLTMAPAEKLARRVGLNPVVTLGFGVYAIFPVFLDQRPRERRCRWAFVCVLRTPVCRTAGARR